MQVVIGEDEVLLREGLRHLLEANGFDVVAAIGTAEELESEISRHRPRLVVTDIRLPNTGSAGGPLLALRLKQAYPTMGVVVLSQSVQRQHAIDLVKTPTGGIGYLLTQRIADVATFTADLRRVARGGTALDPEVVAAMVSRASRVSGAVGSLTPRQREVLALMAEGRSNAAIATHLYMSQKAVVQHTSKIYDAFELPVDPDVHRRVLAVTRFLAAATDTRLAG